MRKKKNQAFHHSHAFWMFVAPSLILFTVFFILPLCLAFVYSFTNYDGWKTMDFVGLDNYMKLFRDADFYSTLKRTFIYTIVNIPFKVICPLLVAALVTTKLMKAKTWVRCCVYVPVLLSELVAGVTINWMFGEQYGLVNYLIECTGGQALEWANNPTLATIVISVASNWKSIGFNMLLFIGGINNISQDVYEASGIDGANKIQTFMKITLPLLKPTTFLVLLLSTVNLLKEFTLIQGITTGGPGTSTTFIIQYIFDQGFNQMRYGYASAIGLIVGIVFVVIAGIQFKLTNEGGEV